jgi:hypothetical protein
VDVVEIETWLLIFSVVGAAAEVTSRKHRTLPPYALVSEGYLRMGWVGLVVAAAEHLGFQHHELDQAS